MPRPRKQRVSRKLMTDKWIVGMVEPTITGPDNIRLFAGPKVYTNYDEAVTQAELLYHRYGKPFVVFAKKCVIGPSRPPVMKTEYLA